MRLNIAQYKSVHGKTPSKTTLALWGFKVTLLEGSFKHFVQGTLKDAKKQVEQTFNEITKITLLP